MVCILFKMTGQWRGHGKSPIYDWMYTGILDNKHMVWDSPCIAQILLTYCTHTAHDKLSTSPSTVSKPPGNCLQMKIDCSTVQVNSSTGRGFIIIIPDRQPVSGETAFMSTDQDHTDYTGVSWNGHEI